MAKLKKKISKSGAADYRKLVSFSLKTISFIKQSKNSFITGKLNSVKAAALEKSVMGIWDTYFLPADTNFDGSVEFLELLVHMKAV